MNKSSLFILAISLTVALGFGGLFVFSDRFVAQTDQPPGETEPLLPIRLDGDLAELEASSLEAIDTTPLTPVATPLDFSSLSVPGPGTTAFYNSALGVFDCASSNCFYAAVDKEHALPENYVPNVSPVNLSGAATLTPEAADALTLFFQAASQEGVSVTVTSSYRSFSTQSETFDNWVTTLQQRDGLSKQEATAQANTFSAHAGHSEHQLGTTVDLNTPGAAAFDPIQNASLYDFIERRAHEFGFVVTYPTGQEALTGYVHEPWHIRYVGRDISIELFETGYIGGKGFYSTQFLRDLNYSI